MYIELVDLGTPEHQNNNADLTSPSKHRTISVGKILIRVVTIGLMLINGFFILTEV